MAPFQIPVKINMKIKENSKRFKAPLPGALIVYIINTHLKRK